MAQFAIPAAQTEYRTVYDGFRGVDLTTDALKIDRSRAAAALNMISDAGGHPEKRVGWRVLHQLQGNVNGMHPCVFGGVQYIVIHAGTQLHLYNAARDEVSAIGGTVKDGRSSAFAMDGKLYLLTGGEYLVIASDGDVVTCKDATVDAYIPTTSFARYPAGGGEVLDAVNLLQAKRRNRFIGDGSSKTYQLDSDNIDGVVAVKVNDAAVAASGYTVDKTKGTVTFSTAPSAPAVSGTDNVEIEFTKANDDYRKRILGCNVCATYLDGFAFVSGNPDYPNSDWRCGYEDPTYWPDTNYHNIGNESTAIKGYLPVGAYLAVIKEQSSQEPSIYMRYGSYNESMGETVFTVSQGAGGVGAVSGSMAVLLGDPMFIAPSGVYAITQSTVTSANLVSNRSYYVDRVLCQHDLSKAVMAAWRGYLVVCVGDAAYVLDGNQQKTWKSNDGGKYVYECYPWGNIPAVSLCVIGEALYFGTADGRLCRFNNDMVDSSGHILMRAFNDDGAAIDAYWETLADDDGFIGQYKTMRKRGCSVTIKPFARSSVQVSVRTERDTGRVVRYSTMDILSWEDLDFERFTFNGIESPQTVMLNSKVKKYLTAQVIVRNAEVNEAFGVYKIEKVYTKGNYNKR